MTTTNLLHAYSNGNVSVKLFDDGSKIREYTDTPKPLFPESIDLKITDYCDMCCSFCHEQSTKQGQHSPLEYLKEIVSCLPAGVELAIGGGNPLSHPDLVEFLEFVKSKDIVANITINQGHLKPFQNLIQKLIDNDLVKGVGISLTGKLNRDFLPKTSNLVFHVIMGIQKPEVLDVLLQISNLKVLILGYKQYGFGQSYYNDTIKENIHEWEMYLPKYFGKLLLSFDNLAIKQLDLKRFFANDEWNCFYMGDDGEFTMYVDAVRKEYAVSSTKTRESLNTSIIDAFSCIRSEC